MRKRVILAGVVVALVVLALVYPPSPPPPSPAPQVVTPQRASRPTSLGVAQVTLELTSDPFQLAPQCSSPWYPGPAVFQLDRAALGVEARLALAAHFTPPPTARSLLRTVGARPASLAPVLAAFSPWGAYAALQVERDWAQADWREAREREKARFIERFGAEPNLVRDPEASEAWDAAMVGLPRPDQAFEQLVDEVALGGGVPGSLASTDDRIVDARDPVQWDHLTEVLTGEGWTEFARHHAAVLICRTGDALSVEQERALATLAPGFSDGELAVVAARVGLQSAFAREAWDDVAWWRARLDEARASCVRWGTNTDLARRVPASFDDLPADLRPAGFAERAERLGDLVADLGTVTADCDRVPCMATVTFTTAVDWSADERVRSTASTVWPESTIAYTGTGSDEGPSSTSLVPVRGDWSIHNSNRLARWRSDSANPKSFRCLTSDQLSELSAQLGEPPVDWKGDLMTAAYTCHRGDPLTADLGSPGVFTGGRWHLGGTSPFLRCVEALATGPVPVDGTRVDLRLSLRPQGAP